MQLKSTALIYIIASTAVSIMTTLEVANAASVKFESDARVKRDSDSFELVKGGSEVEVKPGSSVFAISKTGIPVLIYQPASNSSNLIISDSTLEAATTSALQPRLEADTTEIINGLRKSEAFIQKKSFEQALQILTDLEKKYPRISAVLFLKGTSHYLLNQKTAAVESLEKGLLLDPQNSPAQKLLAQLKGTR